MNLPKNPTYLAQEQYEYIYVQMLAGASDDAFVQDVAPEFRLQRREALQKIRALLNIPKRSLKEALRGECGAMGRDLKKL